MKTVLAGILILAAAGCSTQRELQAEMVRAEVIRIDTVKRYLDHKHLEQKQITWRDSYNIEYVTYAPMYAYYAVGTSITMLKPK